MKTIKNRIEVSIMSRFLRHIFLLGLCVYFFSLIGIEKPLNLLLDHYFLIVISYISSAFIVISYTNPTFKFFKNHFEVKYPVLFTWKNLKIDYEDTESILFRHEMLEKEMFSGAIFKFFKFIIIDIFIPPEYKWLKISKTMGDEFKVYCFGLEFDYYDNSEDIRIEDLKYEFNEKGVKTLWTETDDLYFQND